MRKNPKETYERYYKLMLKACEEEQVNTEYDLCDAIAMARRMRSELNGMIMLYRACGFMSEKESEEQEKRVQTDFDTSRLYGAFMLNTGELCRC